MHLSRPFSKMAKEIEYELSAVMSIKSYTASKVL
jgi:hypothetical protein